MTIHQNKLRLSIRIISMMTFSLLLFSSCKKTIVPNEMSAATIKYFNGGNNDLVLSVEKTSDGGFIYCGNTGGDSAKLDAFLLKVDKNGKQEWYKTYGGDRLDEFRYVMSTSDGGFLAVGKTNSIGKGAINNSFSYYDYTVKLNASGEVEWSKSYFQFEGQLNHAIEAPDHSFLITGSNFTASRNPIYLKLDALGNMLHNRFYNETLLENLPPFLVTSAYITSGYNISIALDGKIVISGTMSKNGVAADLQKQLPFFLNVNPSNGNPISIYPFYNYISENSYNNAVYESNPNKTVKLINLSDGYLIGTNLEVVGGFMKFLLLRTNLTGAVLWSKEYIGLGYSILNNLEVNADGTYLLVGMTSKEALNISYPEKFTNLKIMLTKVNKDGDEIWSHYQGSELNATIPKCVQPLPEGGWSIASYTCLSESGFSKMLWMKVDKDGYIIK